MKIDSPFFRWLTLVALADWLIVRTLARSAIFMPKPPAVLAAYQVLMTLGQFAALLATLMALFGILWLAWDKRRANRGLYSLALVNLLFLSLVFQVIPPGGWMLVVDQLLLVLLILWMGITGIRRAESLSGKTAILLPTLALFAGTLYQSIPSLFTALRLPGPSPFTSLLFNLGELFVVLSGIGFWWAYRSRIHPAQRSSSAIHRPGDFAPYLLASFPALAFTAMHWANPSMTGILSIWSAGLTLYLPWPVYTLSLYLAALTVLITLRQNSLVSWAILLLAAGGYAPQLSTQIFLGLIALSLLSASHGEFSLQAIPLPGSGKAQSFHSSRGHPRHSGA